jgi:hypothetical protein
MYPLLYLGQEKLRFIGMMTGPRSVGRMLAHSLFLGGPCHDIPVPELVKESRASMAGSH